MERTENSTKQAQEKEGRRPIIAVDFDGTLCISKWPEIGEPRFDEVRLIDANALAESDMAKLIDNYLYSQCNLTVGLAAALMPEIDAEPVRHGRWTVVILDIGGGDKIRMLQCSECSRNANMKFDFCPNCGARMDGGADNG